MLAMLSWAEEFSGACTPYRADSFWRTHDMGVLGTHLPVRVPISLPSR
jgi:hypothetical protein